MVCGLLKGMWAVDCYVGCFMVCGLLDIRLLYMWAVEWYVGCCFAFGLFNGMWAVVGYVGS